jgi:hypothetical protein
VINGLSTFLTVLKSQRVLSRLALIGAQLVLSRSPFFSRIFQAYYLSSYAG